MRSIIIIILGILLPVSAGAETVALLPISYTDTIKGEQMSARAELVKDAIFEVIEDVGLTYKDLDPQNEGPGETPCQALACAEAAAQQENLEIGLAIAIIDSRAHFKTAVYLSTQDAPHEAELFGTFDSMIERVCAVVKNYLEKAKTSIETSDDADKVDEQAETSPQEPPAESPITSQTEVTTDDNKSKRRLRPVTFYTLLGVSLAIGAVYTPLETIGYIKLDTVEDQSELKTLQLSSRILMGCTAASVLATTIVAAFTDFKRKKKTKTNATSVRLLPTATVNGGGISLSGIF